MVQVFVGDTLIAEAPTDEIPVVEGNYYFPKSAVKQEYFEDSDTHTTCPWKGEASYYDLKIGDTTSIRDVAWYYPTPKDKAKHIKDHVAFYKTKVVITE